MSLLYRSSELLDEQGTRLYEERIIVLDADDEGDAWKRANEHGPSQEERYTNAEGNWVTWTFERTIEVKAILEDQIADGVEVFSQQKIGGSGGTRASPWYAVDVLLNVVMLLERDLEC